MQISPFQRIPTVYVLIISLAFVSLPAGKALAAVACPKAHIAERELPPGTISIDLKRLADSRNAKDGEALIEKDQWHRLGHLSKFSDYILDLRRIRSGLIHQNTNPQRFQSIFYPLMGTDIALPLIVFPSVRTIVTMDRNPFLNDHELSGDSPLSIRSPLAGPWRRGTHVESEGGNFSRIAGALKEAFPESQILEINILPSKRKSSQLTTIMKFDLHDGFGSRELIYIQTEVLPWYQNNSNYLVPIWSYQPDVAIFKAAEGIAQNGLGRQVVQKLKSVQGLLMEGTASEVMTAGGVSSAYDPEVSIFFSVDELPNLHANGRSYIIPDINFGYNVGVLVTDFQ